MSTADSPDPIAQKAIEWMVQFHSGEMTDTQRAAFEQWRTEHIQNDIACQKIETTLGKMPLLAASSPLRKTLGQSSNRRQFLQRVITFAALASTAGWLYDRKSPLEGLIADLHTGTGERVTRHLSDGTLLTLNARTSVDLKFNDFRREISLFNGQIYVDVQAARVPLVIKTPEGQISLDAGTMTVAARPQGTRIVALNQDSKLRNLANNDAQLAAGQGMLMKAASFSPLQIGPDAEKAWLDGYFEINNQPLMVLIEALRDYRTGFLRVSPEAASLRVSGIFPLDNIDYTLESLAQTLPLVVTRTTDYWVSISKA